MIIKTQLFCDGFFYWYLIRSQSHSIKRTYKTHWSCQQTSVGFVIKDFCLSKIDL